MRSLGSAALCAPLGMLLSTNLLVINEAPGVPRTGQDNCVSVLCVSGLERHHTVQVRRLMLIHVAVMIRQELNDLQLLVGRQYVQ